MNCTQLTVAVSPECWIGERGATLHVTWVAFYSANLGTHVVGVLEKLSSYC